MGMPGCPAIAPDQSRSPQTTITRYCDMKLDLKYLMNNDSLFIRDVHNVGTGQQPKVPSDIRAKVLPGEMYFAGS